MVYEKRCVMGQRRDDIEEEEGECAFCNRPNLGVLCRSCFTRIDKVRAKRECTFHPKVVNIMDLRACTKCSSTNLLEVQAAQSQVLTVPAPPARTLPVVPAPSFPVVTAPALALPFAQAPTNAVFVPAQTKNVADPVRPTRVLPVPDPTPRHDCVCNRRVNFLYCGDCAHVVENGRKRMDCPRHPTNREGLETCPNCNSNELEEG